VYSDFELIFPSVFFILRNRDGFFIALPISVLFSNDYEMDIFLLQIFNTFEVLNGVS